MRRRLDVELVRRGLAPSRTRAADAVHAGRVLVSGSVATSPARQVDGAEPIVVETSERDYVSRGGVKLAAALDEFSVMVEGRRCLDAGASTGGFTEVLLRRGAAHVVAVDAGHGQLAWKLRTDERVTVMERTNIRSLTLDVFGEPADLCVADLSFISLRTAAPHLLDLTTAACDYVLLVKPQYEAGPSRVGKGGVIRDAAVRDEVVREVVAGLAALGLAEIAIMESPITGADGNVEYLLHARRSPAVPA